MRIGTCEQDNSSENDFPTEMNFLICHCRREICKSRTLMNRIMSILCLGYKRKLRKEESKKLSGILRALLCGDIAILDRLGLRAEVSFEGAFSHSHPNRYRLSLSGKNGSAIQTFSTMTDCRGNIPRALSCSLNEICSHICEPAIEANFYRYYSDTDAGVPGGDDQTTDLYRKYETCFFPSGRGVTGQWVGQAEGRVFVTGNIVIINKDTCQSLLYRLREKCFLLGSVGMDKYGRKYILPDKLPAAGGFWKAKVSAQGGVQFRMISGYKPEKALCAEVRRLRDTLPVNGADLDITITAGHQYIHQLPPDAAGTLIYDISMLSDSLNCPLFVHCLIPDLSSRTLLYCYHLKNSKVARFKLAAQARNNIDIFNALSLCEKIKVMTSFLNKFVISANSRQIMNIDNLRVQFSTAIVLQNRMEVTDCREGEWVVESQSGRFPFSIMFRAPVNVMTDSYLPEVNEHFENTGVNVLEHHRFIKNILNFVTHNSP